MNKEEITKKRDDCLNAIESMVAQIRKFENQTSYYNGMLAIIEEIERGTDATIHMPD